jgi:hypothetical protein
MKVRLALAALTTVGTTAFAGSLTAAPASAMPVNCNTYQQQMLYFYQLSTIAYDVFHNVPLGNYYYGRGDALREYINDFCL